MTEANAGKPRYTVSVCQLVDQVILSGDIDFRFTRRGSALEGIRGHQRIQRQRPADYQAEATLEGTVECPEYALVIRGRADGIYHDEGRVVLEEIKTIRAPVDELPQPVRVTHWAQAKMYAFLHSRAAGLSDLIVQLCYFNLESEEITILREPCSREELETFHDEIVAAYLDWITRRRDWQELRDRSIARLEFPYPTYRTGQRDMAVAVYRALVGGDQLLVEAPTGIGKTLASLFPGIKAMGEGHHQQIFYLTAKTSGRMIAEDTLRTLAGSGLRLRSITITAKDKICFSPGMPCDPDHCSYAKGYYDRVARAVTGLLDRADLITRERIEEHARDHEVCPFELTLDVANWVDCVICDYNYVFDPSVYLRRFFDETVPKYSFLIDEAHNLVDRGRDMFSADLCRDDLMAVKRQVRTRRPDVAASLQVLNRAFLELRRDNESVLDETAVWVSEEMPANVVRAARKFCHTAEAYLADPGEGRPDEALQQLYFDTLAFVRTSERFDSSYVTLLRCKPGGRYRGITLSLYCIDPSAHLEKGFRHAQGAVLFSATLTPAEYYRRLLGAGGDARWLHLSSPFPGENLGVYVARNVATTYRKRGQSFDAIVELIRSMISARTGNYLVYFPSYRYMAEVHKRFEARAPDIEILIQRTAMPEGEREAFLASFAPEPSRTVVGFAVMGGVFGEGIDLTGNRLIGVMIVSVGLPQLGIEKDLIMDYFADSGFGFEFAYVYPGMTRVLQTAGRVIRSEEDRGVICLVDERYAQYRYRTLLPDEWRPAYIRSAADLADALASFWHGT